MDNTFRVLGAKVKDKKDYVKCLSLAIIKAFRRY